MAFPVKQLFAILLLSSHLISTSARTLEPKSSLSSRLKVAEEGPSSCWDALMEIKSCSTEVVLFFLNGETHLGENCCNAIAVIEHHCWPAMLGTLGITPEETNVLRGYCDAAMAAPAPESDAERCVEFPRLLH